MSEVAAALDMDRTHADGQPQAARRRGLVKIAVDQKDKRSRRLIITTKGRATLKAAFPIGKRRMPRWMMPWA